MIDFKKKFEEGRDFLEEGVWQIRRQKLPKSRSYPLKLLRILILAVRGFIRNDCPVRASALTFYTILSVVPLLAMAFGIAKGFGFEKLLEEQISPYFLGQENLFDRVTLMARNMLDQTKGGAIAGIGLLVLFWSLVKVMSHIERSINKIWEVPAQRSWRRRLSDYMTIMFLFVVILILSGSLNVYITAQVTRIAEDVSLLMLFNPFIFFLLKLIPYVLFWFLLTIIYIIIPNTTVPFTAAIFGGVVGGTMYQGAQWGYIRFQVGVASYNAIYGSFAALPLFLVWLQLSWMILLMGAQLSFAYRNADAYEFRPKVAPISTAFRNLLALRTMHLITHAFQKGEPPLSAYDLANLLESPLNPVKSILDDFVGAGILSEVLGDGEETVAYQPARDIKIFTIRYIIDALDHHGTEDIPLRQTAELKALSNSMKQFKEEMRGSSANRHLTDI